MAYAFRGSCDSHIRSVTGVEALAAYGDADDATVARFTVTDGFLVKDELDAMELRRWVDGHDPSTGEQRGRDLTSPAADLILDGTLNAPKSYSIAALINAEIATQLEALQDRLRDRIIATWQRELNARRGAGGSIREPLHRIEVVELQHRRSRALDPHMHRHLWLNVKVQGNDGKWSNVDSRVAMKLHTLINAEGDLAARTDPQWIEALARHGYSLAPDGEIAELAQAVRPLSRRSNQIEANRAKFLVQWRADHPGQEPSHDVLQNIDRLAWATGRPNKPDVVDEGEWEQLILDEVRAIDGTLLAPRDPRVPRTVPLNQVDLDLLAARAIVDADSRATGCGGRFSGFDLRAGAIRAVAASGVVALREDLQQLIDDVVMRAYPHASDLLGGEGNRPEHIKGYMAASTAALKVELAERFDALEEVGELVDRREIGEIASRLLDRALTLDAGQTDAAAAIAGTDRLVSVTGPAGAGKTTMLRVARLALGRQGRNLVVVAPTKKAASVAGREIGATASSLHALLADFGWRWGRDKAGAEVWTRLRPGDLDARTGFAYEGPRRFTLRAGDRVVVDEAGMVDLNTASALAALAQETGAGLAMVGDHMQAMPVGHAGAMACMTRRATAVVELTAVHRFNDSSYAALTLRMREPASKELALDVATDLDERDLIHRVADAGHARDVMIESYFRWSVHHRRVALVTGTNEEADAINEGIQQRRVDAGQLFQTRIAIGRDEQRLLEGDVVQTRLNDRTADVENRAMWTIGRILPDAIELQSIGDSGDVRRVSLEYAAQYVHLGYASTVHGIQGETTDASIVGPGVDAAGLYVGMTRGRAHNEAIAIAHTSAAAREQIAESMMRGTLEVSIDDSVRAARRDLGRSARGPETERPPGPAQKAVRTESDLAQVVAGWRQGAQAMREALEQLRDWMDASRRAVREADAARAAADAVQHGRAPHAAVPNRGQRDVLAAALAARTDEYIRLEREYAATLGRIDDPECKVPSGELRGPATGIDSARLDRASFVESAPPAEPRGRVMGL